MKAGKGYLPLHVEWPAGRIADILQQAGVEQLWLTRAQSALCGYPDTERSGLSTSGHRGYAG